MVLHNNVTSSINVESWFIPIDILVMICAGFVIIFTIFCIIIVIFDKTCYTVPMMLITNSFVAELTIGIVIFSGSLSAFRNDLEEIGNEYSLCSFQGYLGYTASCAQNYSYLLQAIYRYIIIVYPTRVKWQSGKFQCLIICLTWIFAFLCPIVYLVTDQIKYDMNNQVCQLPLGLSLTRIYDLVIIFVIPSSLTIFIYLKLVRYVRDISKRVTVANTLLRAQREVKMVRRIDIPFLGVTTIGFPYAMFVFIAFFTNSPIYYFRIAIIFMILSLIFVTIALYHFTDPIKIAVKKRINRQTNIIVPATA